MEIITAVAHFLGSLSGLQRTPPNNLLYNSIPPKETIKLQRTENINSAGKTLKKNNLAPFNVAVKAIVGLITIISMNIEINKISKSAPPLQKYMRYKYKKFTIHDLQFTIVEEQCTVVSAQCTVMVEIPAEFLRV